VQHGAKASYRIIFFANHAIAHSGKCFLLHISLFDQVNYLGQLLNVDQKSDLLLLTDTLIEHINLLIKGNGVLSFTCGMRPLIGGRSVTPFC
jgi:hypothetical protein